jgi:hypothetical protein
MLSMYSMCYVSFEICIYYTGLKKYKYSPYISKKIQIHISYSYSLSKMIIYIKKLHIQIWYPSNSN